MAVLNSIFAFMGISQAVTPNVVAPGSMWHILILKSFAFVADYGWRIVVFTVLLKLVISPLDFYQRYKMNKNQKITERLKPTMDKIARQYGDNKQAFQQKQMELQRKEGYSYFSACLPMIITLVVFITLWLSMQTIARYMMFKEYTTLYDEYTYVTEQIYNPVDPEHPTPEEAAKSELSIKIGQDVVYQMYYNGLDESYTATLKANAEFASAIPSDFKLLRDGAAVEKVQSSFLWIKNIWAPDVPWGNQAILSFATFKSGIGDYAKASVSKLDTEVQDKLMSEDIYNRVMGKLLNDETASRTNGYLVLPILVVLLSFGAQFLSMYQQKRAGQTNAQGGMAMSMKVMMFLMPVMMAVFAIQSASIFSLYMATNSAVTLCFNFLFSGIIKLIDKIKASRKNGIASGSPRGTVAASGNPNVIHYVKGANPNAGAREAASSEKPKKSERGAQRTVVKSNRPDPNDLINMDMSSDRDRRKK